MKIETKADALVAVQLLAEALTVPVPKVEFGTARLSRSKYLIKGRYRADRSLDGYRETATIRLAPRHLAAGTLTESLVHEFAHHVNAMKACDGLEPYQGHDWIFYRHLKAVARAWYGTETGYRWAREYATIKAMAQRDNLH